MTKNQSTDVTISKHENKEKDYAKWRCLVAYWILGLCNNYGYVVMLTAAGDIINESSDEKIEPRQCRKMSTGVILLADIGPALLVKFFAPFLPFFVHVRIALCVMLAATGYLLVAFSQSDVTSLMGVVATSFCHGLGEVTFLQYSSFYDKNVISTWSSGTGGAGVIGSLSYSLLQTLGLTKTMLIMLVVPIAMAVSFWVILPKPQVSKEDLYTLKTVNKNELKEPKKVFKRKLKHIPSLMKFMIPLGLVYLFEYFINQGTFELINFDTFIDGDSQYRWLQVDYQIGVFLSRSSVNLYHFRYIWVLSILQFVNVIVFTTHVIFEYLPSFYLILALVFWEGLLGGGAYVNTFYRISSEIAEEDKQFSMATTSFADSIGITIAGFLAIFAHNSICTLPLPENL